MPYLLRKLPNTLSGLLRVAVEDCLEIEAEGRHRFDMDTYYERVNNHCVVCMAGAVMLCRTSEQALPRVAGPSSYDHRTADKLRTIDSLRVGNVDVALHMLDRETLPLPGSRSSIVLVEELIEDNFDGREGRAPWQIYLEAADILEEAGL